MGLSKATITIRSPTQRKASRSASAGCRIRATDLGGRRHVVRTRSVNGNATVVEKGPPMPRDIQPALPRAVASRLLVLPPNFYMPSYPPPRLAYIFLAMRWSRS